MSPPIRLGVIGLGRAFTLMLPTWLGDERIRLVAAYDPMAEACQAFKDRLGGVVCADAAQVCAHPGVDWVYVASPHGHHAQHVKLAAAHGKPVLVEKPMAIALDDAQAMVAACRAADVALMVGHSHSFDAPVLAAKALIQSGRWGQVRMIQALQYTDFLYRPRRPEELQTALGGGVIFSQAAHQVDVVRMLAGAPAQSVKALTGQWDASRPTEGAYSALIEFESGAWANLSYSGYGFFDSDVWMNGVGELGYAKPLPSQQNARHRLSTLPKGESEAALKAKRNFGGAHDPGLPAKGPDHHQHFGPVIVSCDQADLQLLPDGVTVHDQTGSYLHRLPPPSVPRQSVVDEMWACHVGQQALVHDGAWGMATLEICLAMLDSARTRESTALRHQG